MRCKGDDRHSSSRRPAEWRTRRNNETRHPCYPLWTHEAHEWLTEAHSDAEISEDLYYVADDYHSDDSGYDSDMYKKCWEDDF
jgi:hypothetical protein